MGHTSEKPQRPVEFEYLVKIATNLGLLGSTSQMINEYIQYLLEPSENIREILSK